MFGQIVLVNDPVNGGIICVAGCVLNSRSPVREFLMSCEVRVYNLTSQRIISSGICRMSVVRFRSVICGTGFDCTVREMSRSSGNCVSSPIGGRYGTCDAYNMISNINVITSAIFRDIRSIDSRSING